MTNECNIVLSLLTSSMTKEILYLSFTLRHSAGVYLDFTLKLNSLAHLDSLYGM